MFSAFCIIRNITKRIIVEIRKFLWAWTNHWTSLNLCKNGSKANLPTSPMKLSWRSNTVIHEKALFCCSSCYFLPKKYHPSVRYYFIISFDWCHLWFSTCSFVHCVSSSLWPSYKLLHRREIDFLLLVIISV